MNYAAHYNRLIARANGRVLTGYRERHHVLPKCMSGTNAPENIVSLTAEEHYVAHQLLVKMYPTVRGLATAAVRMAKQCTGNKAYGWLRRRNAEDNRKCTISKKHRAAIGAYWRGRKRSPENCVRIGAAKKGKALSSEHKAKIGAANKRGKLSIEHRAKISASVKASPGVQRIASARRGSKRPPRSQEWIEKNAASTRNFHARKRASIHA